MIDQFDRFKFKTLHFWMVTPFCPMIICNNRNTHYTITARNEEEDGLGNYRCMFKVDRHKLYLHTLYGGRLL